MTWRFGGNGAVLAVSGFTACMFPSLPRRIQVALVPAVAAQGLVFSFVGSHSEGGRFG